MEFEPTRLPEVVLIKPRVFGDARGFFFESWHEERFSAAGIGCGNCDPLSQGLDEMLIDSAT